MIYVITHKAFDDSIIDSNYMKVLHVGKNQDSKNTYFRDDTGTNISNKNANYCELTGLYWIFMNCHENDDEITGLLHYRRYFCTKKEFSDYAKNGSYPRPLSYDIIKQSLDKADAILPVSVRCSKTVGQVYGYFHNEEDLILTKKAIAEKQPDYLNAFERVMSGHKYYYGNMIITKKKYLDKYTEWLFSILDYVETRIDTTKYTDEYQKRVFGFIAERLLQVWLLKNNIRVVEFPVYNTEKRPESKIQELWKRLFKTGNT